MKPHPVLVAWIDALRAHNHPITGSRLCRDGHYCALGLLADCDPEAEHVRKWGLDSFNWPNHDFKCSAYIPRTRLAEILGCDRSDTLARRIQNVSADNDRVYLSLFADPLHDDIQTPMRKVHEEIADKIVSAWMEHHGLTECPSELAKATA